jgi:hypothetical protein
MGNKRLLIVIGSLAGILLLSIGIPLLLLGGSDPDQAFSASIPGDDPDRPNPTRVITQAPVASIPEGNCTYPLEFWVERPTEWPEQVTAGEIVFSREEMVEIFLDTGEDPGLMVLKHLYTTFLNILHGADMSSVDEVILDANTWLSLNPPGSLLSEFNLRRGRELAALLEGYNNGVFGPGLCPDAPIIEELTTEEESAGSESLALLLTNTPDTDTTSSRDANVQNTPVPTAAVRTVQPAAPTSSPEPVIQPSPLSTNTPPPPAPADPLPTSTPQPTQPVITIAPAPTNTPAPTSTLTPTLLPTNTPLPTLTPSNPPPPTNTPVPTMTPTQSLLSDGVCTGTIGAVTLDELTVPSGASCSLNGTTINGNIDVEGGATLVANSISASGNLRGRSVSRVEVLSGSYIGGNLRVDFGGSARVASTTINGNLTLESNGGGLEISGNQVGGNVEINMNTGGVSIINNYIGGNLKCQSNSPPPTGGSNTVEGNLEGQCAGLN